MSMAEPGRPRHSAWIKVVLACIGAIVLAWLGWRSRNELLQVLTSVSPAFLISAIFAGVALNLVYGLQMDALLAKYGAGHDHRRRVGAYLLSQPGKYVPGKVWSSVLQAFTLGRENELATITVVNIELAGVAMIQTTGLGLACLSAESPWRATGILIAAAIATVALASSRTAYLLARIAPKSLRLPSGQGLVAFGATRTQLLLAAAAIGCNFLASWCLVRSAHPAVAVNEVLPLLACLYLAFAASVLAVPVPAGLGIREAAAVGAGSLLAPEISPALIISIALLARCWQLLVDILSLSVGALLLLPKPPRHRSRESTLASDAKDIVFVLRAERQRAAAGASLATTSILPLSQVTIKTWLDLCGLLGAKKVVFRRLRYGSKNTFLLTAYQSSQLVHVEWIVPSHKLKGTYSFVTPDSHAILACETHIAFRGRGLYPDQLARVMESGISNQYFIWAAEDNLSSLNGIRKAGGVEIGHLTRVRALGLRFGYRFCSTPL